ncbi:MAG: sulfur carrier protein ThiS [Actinomycetota bacterium]|nr:sulfur carrier protein ThiS [Actinomycetota bacterium]
MLVTINGEQKELEPSATVASVVNSMPGAPQGRGTAVALSGEVVPRTLWPSTELADGDQLEIVVAVQGG